MKGKVRDALYMGWERGRKSEVLMKRWEGRWGCVDEWREEGRWRHVIEEEEEVR